jgi:hypothetical protein
MHGFAMHRVANALGRHRPTETTAGRRDPRERNVSRAWGAPGIDAFLIDIYPLGDIEFVPDGFNRLLDGRYDVHCSPSLPIDRLGDGNRDRTDESAYDGNDNQDRVVNLETDCCQG